MSDGINLSKGGRIDLSKAAPTLTKLRLELKWKPNPTDTGAEFDVDSSVFMCKYDGAGDPKLASDNHFIFYNKTVSPDGSVVHSGDDTTGGTGEVVYVELGKISPEIDEMSFIVTIHEATARRQNFGQISKCSITLFDDVTGTVIGGYQLDDDFTSETAVQFGSLFKKDNGSWNFKAIGTGYSLGLKEFVQGYGGNVA